MILKNHQTTKKIIKFPMGQKVNTFSSIFLPKIKVNSLRNYTGGAELYAHAFFAVHLGTPLTIKATPV